MQQTTEWISTKEIFRNLWLKIVWEFATQFHCRWLRKSFCVANNMLSCQSQLLKWTNWWLDVPETDSQMSSENTNLRETSRASKEDKKETTSKLHSDSFSAVTTRVHSRNQSLTSLLYVISQKTNSDVRVKDFVHQLKDKRIPLSSVSLQTLTVTHSAAACSVCPSNSKDSKILFSAQNSKSEAEHRNRNICLCFEGTKEITKCELSNWKHRNSDF